MVAIDVPGDFLFDYSFGFGLVCVCPFDCEVLSWVGLNLASHFHVLTNRSIMYNDSRPATNRGVWKIDFRICLFNLT